MVGTKAAARIKTFSQRGSTFLSPRRLRQSIYLPLLGLSMGLMLARVLIFAKVLAVDEFAALNLALIASTLVSTCVCFGLFPDLQRKLPVDLQKGDGMTAMARIALTVLGSVTVGFAAVVVLGLMSLTDFRAVALAAIGILHGFTQQLFLIVTSESRSAGEPVRYSLQSLLRAGLVLLLAVPAAIVTGSAVAGLLAEAAIAVALSVTILFRFADRYAGTWAELPTQVRRLVKGTPTSSLLALMLVSFAMAASANIDRWAAASSLSKAEFAQYTFAATTMVFAFSAQAMINAAVFPAIARRMSGSPQAAFQLTALVSFGGLGISVLAAIPAILATGVAVSAFYPLYEKAVPLVAPMAFAGIFRLADFWTSYLIIAGRENVSLAINLVAGIVPTAAWLTLSDHSPASIAYLAVAISASIFLLSMIWSLRAAHLTHGG